LYISVDHVTFELETHFMCFVGHQIKDEMGAACGMYQGEG